jgi:hypothetical protein
VNKRALQLRDYQSEAGEVAEPFNDDVFTYDGGMAQSIGGFGRNAMNDVRLNSKIARQRKVTYAIGELVRWCRSFNRENHELKQRIAELEQQRDELLNKFIDQYKESGSADAEAADRLVPYQGRV